VPEPIATPAQPGQLLTKGELDTTPSQQLTYRSGVGKLIHAVKWSRVDCLNAVQELARHMGAGNTAHIKALKRFMSYLLQTPERGGVLKNIWL
jgi:hypothetical protein